MNAKRTVMLGRILPPSRPSSARCRSWPIRTWRNASPPSSSSASSTRIRRSGSESPQPSRGPASNRKLKPNRLAKLPFAQNPFHPPQVFFCVNAYRFERRLSQVDCDAMIEEAELFQAFAALQFRLRPRAEGIEGGFAIGVEAEMLVAAHPPAAIAIKRNGRPGKIKGAAIQRGDYLHGIGIGYILRCARSFECAYLDAFSLHQPEQDVEMLAPGQGLIALHVHVNVSFNGLRNFVDAVGAAAMLRRGQATRPAILAANGGNLV